MLALRVIKGPSMVGQQIQIDSNAIQVLGRSKEANIQLPSNGVSKKHCQLRELPGSKLEIIDLGSSNGTFVNGLMIKSHIAKPGDTISLNEFVFRVEALAPKMHSDPIHLSSDFEPSSDLRTASFTDSKAEAQQTSTKESLNFIERTIFPLADEVAKQADVKYLLSTFFIIWSLAVAALSVFPFSDTANFRIEQRAAETAKLYARQLARVNESFIKEFEYQRLVPTLDQRVGLTPGVLRSMIIDANNAQILSPPELVGRSLANPESVAGLELLKKIQDENGYSKIDSRGVIHALAPIRVGVSDPEAGGAIVSKVVAVSYVEMDATKGNLKAADLVDSALSAIIFALVLGFIIIIMAYRWIEGGLSEIAKQMESVVDGKSSSVQVHANWTSLQKISSLVNTVLSKSGASNNMPREQSLEWAISTVESLPIASAALDSNLTVISWNTKMESIIGIRASMAIGNDISSASRDIAFEGAIRDLSSQSLSEPGIAQRKRLDFSGREHEITMVFSDGAHLVTIVLAEEGF